MKKLKICICMFYLVNLLAYRPSNLTQTIALEQASDTNACVHVNGNQFITSNKRFYMQGYNYYHRIHNWKNFWPYWNTPDGKIAIETELKLAADSGANTIRIFLNYDYFKQADTDLVPLQAKEDLHQFLTLTDNLELRVLITLFDQMPVGANDNEISNYLNIEGSVQLVDSLLSKFESNGSTIDFSNDCRILGWDVKNEVDRDYLHDANEDGPIDINDKIAVQTWAKSIISHLKANAIQPVTISTYAAHDDQNFDPNIVRDYVPDVDFIAIHYFLDDYKFPQIIEDVLALNDDKPLILEEFGQPSQIQGDNRTERDQAAYLNTILSLVRAYRLAGSLVWTLVDFTELPPDIEADNPNIKHMGIFRYDDNEDVYISKVAADPIFQHFEENIVFLDLFYSYVDPNNCERMIGWSTDKFVELSACPPLDLNSTNVFEPTLPGYARITKLAPDNSATPGLIYSPIILPCSSFNTLALDFEISNYFIADPVDLSGNIDFDVGVKLLEDNKIVWLQEHIDPSQEDLDITIPFEDSLKNNPSQSFQILFRLNSIDSGKNGYSAGFEMDAIRISTTDIGGAQCLDLIYLPLIIKP